MFKFYHIYIKDYNFIRKSWHSFEKLNSSYTNLNKLRVIFFRIIVGQYQKYSVISQMHEDLNTECVNHFKTQPNELVRNIMYDINTKYKHKKVTHIIA